MVSASVGLQRFVDVIGMEQKNSNRKCRLPRLEAQANQTRSRLRNQGFPSAYCGIVEAFSASLRIKAARDAAADAPNHPDKPDAQ